MAETTEEVIAEVRNIREGDMRKTLTTSIRNNVTGAAMGLVAGILYGTYRKHNVFVTGVIGLVVGGLGSYFLIGNEE